MYDFCLPQESEVRNRPPFANLKKKRSWFHVKWLLKRTIAVMKEMESPKILWKQNQFVQGEGGICLKETSRDEKHKEHGSLPLNWRDLPDRFFSQVSLLASDVHLPEAPVCSFGVEEFAVYNHQDSSTNTRDLTEFGTVLWNQLELSQTGNSCPLWNCLNCYTYSWHKSSEFSQTGRLDPLPQC